MPNFTIEELEALKEGITQGERFLHEGDWGDLCVVNEAGRDLTWGDQLVVKVECGHPKNDGEAIAAIPALLDQLIATEAKLQQLMGQIENLADWHDVKASKARVYPHPQEKERFIGKAEAHETARNKLTQILEGHNE